MKMVVNGLNENTRPNESARLIFYCCFELNQSTVDRYATLNGLVKLVAKAKINTWIDKMSILKSIEELHIFDVAPFTDLLYSTAKNSYKTRNDRIFQDIF